MNAALAGSRWLVVQQVERVDERAAVDHRLHGQHAACQRAQPRGREAAGEVLGEHGQAFLQLLVAGQPGEELLQRLLPAVEVGEQVRADFVVQQRLDGATGGRRAPLGHERRSWATIMVEARSLPHVHRGDEAGKLLVVVVDLLAGGGDDLGGVERSGALSFSAEAA